MDHPHSSNHGQREFEIALVTHFQWLAGEEGKKKNAESHSVYNNIAELLGSKWNVHQAAPDLATCRFTDLYMRFTEYPKLLYKMEKMVRPPPRPPFKYVPPPPRPLVGAPYRPPPRRNKVPDPIPGPRVLPNAPVVPPYPQATDQHQPQSSTQKDGASGGHKRAFIDLTTRPPNTPMASPPYPQNSPLPGGPYPHNTLYHRNIPPPPGPPFPSNSLYALATVAGEKRPAADLTTTAHDDDTTEGQEPNKKRAKHRTFEERYQELKEFYDEHGHIRIRQKSKENKTGLLEWVRKQKTVFFRDNTKNNTKKGPDFEKHKKLLADLGVQWNPRADSEEKSWRGWYEKLKLYKEQHGGEAHVKRRHAQYPKLGYWCSRQRHKKSASTLSHTHEQLLNDIGFKWTSDLNNTVGVFQATPVPERRLQTSK